MKLFLILFLVAVLGCDQTKKTPTIKQPVDREKPLVFQCDRSDYPTHNIVVRGEFSATTKNIAPPDSPATFSELPQDVVTALNKDRQKIVCGVLSRKGFSHAEDMPPLILTIGGEKDGLRLVLEMDDEKKERRIPPALSIAELKTNVEHTLDALVPAN